MTGAASVVLVASWAQPLIEQFTAGGGGGGNFTRLAGAFGESTTTSGYGLGARIVASVVALPPWWLRPSFKDAFDATQEPGGWRPSSAVPALLSLATIATVLVVCLWDVRRRRDRHGLRVVSTAGVALLAALVTAARAPISVLPNSAHSYRWLWPVGAFVFFAVLVVVVQRLAERGGTASVLVGGLATVTVALAVLNVPTSDQGAIYPPGSVPRARALVRQLEALDVDGTVLVAGPTRFNDPYAPAVMVELQQRGIPFVVDPRHVSPRQLGTGRRFTGDNADVVLYVEYGSETRDAPEGTRLVADVGLPAREQRELSKLERAIGDYLTETGGPPLNRRGEAALRDGDLAVLGEQSSRPPIDPQPLLDSGELAFMVHAQLLALPDEWVPRFERYADLSLRWETETVAVFVGPLDSARHPKRSATASRVAAMAQ